MVLCIYVIGYLVHVFIPFLQESLRVQEFYLQVEEEETWIREKEPLASSTDYGRDMNTVIKLQQKHQALEAEIQGLLHGVATI